MGIITPTIKRLPSTPSVHPDSFPTDITKPNANKRGRTLLNLPENIELLRWLPRSGRGGRRFKSCHSDQLSSHEKSSWGTIWGTKRSPREHLLCFFKHAANSLKPGHAAYAGDVRFTPESGH